MADDEKRSGRERPANDNLARYGPKITDDADAVERLDKLVLMIARLIGRRMAREDYEKAIHAANDNKKSSGRTGEKQGRSGSDEEE